MKEKRKLDQRDTYTNAPRACGNCAPLQNGVLRSLNREGTLSVPGLKTSSNNPDVDLQGNATWIGTERFYLSFLQIFFQFLPPLKRWRALEAIR